MMNIRRWFLNNAPLGAMIFDADGNGSIVAIRSDGEGYTWCGARIPMRRLSREEVAAWWSVANAKSGYDSNVVPEYEERMPTLMSLPAVCDSRYDIAVVDGWVLQR